VDTRIVKHFNSSNSIYIYLPDYGILVINTADTALLATGGGGFVREKELLGRLDILIKLVESSSLAYLGQLTGKKGARLLWRKEQHLRKTSQELIENEKNYRDLYENAPIAYITMDPEGRILKCNQKAEILSGYTRDELVNQRAAPLFLESASLGSHIADIGNRLVNDDGVKDMELQMRPKNGVPLWVSVSVDGIRDKTGRIVELRAMVMDISGRKSLEKQLFQAQKMEAVGTLAGGIAHDFNNILSPISGYTEMMLMDMGAEDSNKEFLTIVLECVNHAKKLVNQILTFSKQKEHELIPLNLGDAVRESMALVRSFLPATIRVNLDIDPACGHIQADPVQIHQVIMNLVTNAFHAMEENGGVLDISLGEEKNIEAMFPEAVGQGQGTNFVRLSVKDTGMGIDPAILDKIFDPYFSTKKEGKGSGIGLSVVHGVVESHNGYIRVRANGDKGSCFDLYFPVCQKRLVIQPEKRQDLSIKTGNESILLVDDDEKVGIMETHMLQKLGYTVTCLNGSLAAKAAFKEDSARFDLVITDMTMPDLTGIQLANELQSIQPNVPVILCTGFGDTIKKNHSDLPFIRGFLKKPVGIRDLSHMVRRVLDQPDSTHG
jgi:PAS domain S-box-containing protein